MSTYAIGDVQGCYDQLQDLLSKINFKIDKDILWFAGDLVNRGPKSLETLHFVKSLGANAKIVLGNHDMYLLSRYYKIEKAEKHDTLDQVLEATDIKELITWLQQQPLLVHDDKLNVSMVHAGIYPSWDLNQAKIYAKEVEGVLQGDNYLEFFKHMYGNTPNLWDENLTGIDRLRFITNTFTRMRFCKENGSLELNTKTTIQDSPKNLIAWFNYPERKLKQHDIIFGHWAALCQKTTIPHVIPIDSGCVWGNMLTAYCLETKVCYNVAGLCS